MDATETHPTAAAAEPQSHEAIERGPRVLPLRQAAAWLEEQGVPIGYEALRTMADRERIVTVKRDGKRHVEMRTLRSLAAARRNEMLPSAAPAAAVPHLDVEALLDRVVDAERRAAAAETRGMIAERSESTLTEELHEARARIAALEEQVLEASQRRRWFRKHQRSTAQAAQSLDVRHST